LSRVNFIVSILLLALGFWAAVGGLHSAFSSGEPTTGLLGAAFLLSAFFYLFMRRIVPFPHSKKFWDDLHVLLGLGGLALILIHSGGNFFSLAGLLTVALFLLFLLGLNLRFLSSRQIHKNIDFRAHLFYNPGPAETRLEHNIQAKKALLEQMDGQASEGTFSLSLHNWLRNPWKAARYLWLTRAERRWVCQICGSPPLYLNFSQGWGRYLHIGLGIAAMIGLLFHLMQSCPYF